MTTRPGDVRIDDLGAPIFATEIEQMMGAVGPLAKAIPWKIEAALDQAASESGLDDFGEDIYSEPLAVFLEGARVEGDLSAMGEVMVWGQVIQFLKNRLLVEEEFKRHPEIAGEVIDRPIVIAGLPRTGTTHLHNLISSDPALHFLPWWESLEPLPPLAEAGGNFEVDPRWHRAGEGIALRDRIMPYFNRMHDMWPDHAHEEIHLLAIGGSTMFFETLAPSERWKEYYCGTDQTPWYRYMHRVLQLIQARRKKPGRWILKSPQHLEQFAPLSRVFPDATTVVTHRDPVSITASFATMATYSARLSLRTVDPTKVGGYWAKRIEEMLHACVDDRELLAPERSLDVLFHEFMADDMATVAAIYALADQPLDSGARRAMDSFMQDHPRGKHGRVLYSLADFGLVEKERRQALNFYSERFGVVQEGN
ncbi:MAG: sulfotransferase [Myxococcota bacterium]|nr:sulfotransferase [Myxococcota bacterium]